MTDVRRVRAGTATRASEVRSRLGERPVSLSRSTFRSIDFNFDDAAEHIKEITWHYGKDEQPDCERVIPVHSDMGLAQVFARSFESVDVGMLPPGTVWINGQASRIIIEEPPRMRRLRLVGTASCRGANCGSCPPPLVMVPTPWVVYVATIRRVGGSQACSIASLRVYFRHAPLYSFDDETCIAPFPNMRTDASVCWGHTSGIPATNGDTIADAWAKRYPQFWDEAFNGDYDYFRNTEFFSMLTKHAMTYTHHRCTWRMWEELNEDEACEITRQILARDRSGHALRQVVKAGDSEFEATRNDAYSFGYMLSSYTT